MRPPGPQTLPPGMLGGGVWMLRKGPMGASRLSIGSENSLLSIGSKDSILSIGSSHSVLSIASVRSAGSFASIGSVGSAFSLLSAGSVFSFASAGSVFSALSAGSRSRPFAPAPGSRCYQQVVAAFPPSPAGLCPPPCQRDWAEASRRWTEGCRHGAPMALVGTGQRSIR